MQIQAPVPEAVIMIAETGRKPRPLRLSSAAECDELIKAAVAAKAILLAAQPVNEAAGAIYCNDEHVIDGVVRYCARPAHDGPHNDDDNNEWAYEDAERHPCPAGWGSATPSQRCTLDGGHDGEHLDSDGCAWAEGVIPHRTRPSLRGEHPYPGPAAFPWPCPEPHCARLDGHAIPHRDKDGGEWDTFRAAPGTAAAPCYLPGEHGPAPDGTEVRCDTEAHHAHAALELCTFHGGSGNDADCALCTEEADIIDRAGAAAEALEGSRM